MKAITLRRLKSKLPNSKNFGGILAVYIRYFLPFPFPFYISCKYSIPVRSIGNRPQCFVAA